MKTLLKTLTVTGAAAGLMLAAAQPALAQAQAAVGPLVPGLAIADLDGVVANSSAYKTAQVQRPVTYKAQLDQAEARRKAITAQLTPLVENCGKHAAWVIEVVGLRHNREALRGYFAVLKLDLLEKRLADLEQEWNRFDGQIKQLEARLQEQRIQVDELKQLKTAAWQEHL